MSTKSVLESFKPQGHLEVIKRFLDGSEEIVFSDHNMITVGMGQNLSVLFGDDTGTASIKRFQFGYFQLGDGDGSSETSAITGLVDVFTAADYGSTNLTLSTHNRTTGGGASTISETFVEISQAMINKPAPDQMQFIIDIDTDTANGEDISEVGLFARDPYDKKTSGGTEGSLLCAYRYIPAITKSASFALTFKWTIEF